MGIVIPHMYLAALNLLPLIILEAFKSDLKVGNDSSNNSGRFIWASNNTSEFIAPFLEGGNGTSSSGSGTASGNGTVSNGSRNNGGTGTSNNTTPPGGTRNISAFGAASPTFSLVPYFPFISTLVSLMLVFAAFL